MISYLLNIFFIILLISYNRIALAEESVDWVAKTLRFNFTIHNSAKTETGVEHLNVYIPVSGTNQRVVFINATYPYENKIDDLGNNQLIFTINTMPAYSKIRIGITTVIEVSGLPQKSKKINSFLGSELMVESTDNDIEVLAHSMRKALPIDTVYNAYSWIRNNINYSGFVADDKGALDAYKTKKGDCSEYAYLLAALNRANNIPTKVLGGYTVQSNSVIKASDYHNWNEVYINGKWQLVDAQKGVFLLPMSDYVVTRIIARGFDDQSNSYVHRYENPENGLNITVD